MPETLPRFMFLEINRRCNLHCGHCHFWKYDDNDMFNYMRSERLNELIAEFAQFSGHKGTVVSCGGEPMLDLERYLSISDAAHRSGIKFFSVSNGTQVTTKAIADEIIARGPDEITISLNSHKSEIHDRTRGVQGAFGVTVAGIFRLLEARERNEFFNNKLWSFKKIFIMTIVAEYNYRELPDFFDWALNAIGVDKLKLNMLQPTFGSVPGEDTFYKNSLVRDPDDLIRVLKICDERFHLALNPAWLENVHMYHRSFAGDESLRKGWKLETLDAICNTGERNIMVDAHGFAKLCFSNDYRGELLKVPGDLERFWNRADDIRAKMQGCTKACGISHSVRKEPATLKRLKVVP